MMLDESEEGASEEDGEEDGRTEKREHGGGISAAPGAVVGADPPAPAPQATGQDDQPAAPRGRAARGCYGKTHSVWHDRASGSHI